MDEDTLELFVERTHHQYADEAMQGFPFPFETEWGGEKVAPEDGIHGYLNSYYIAVLRNVLDQLGVGVFLDLGSGSGAPVIYAAHHGWDAYGIDFCDNCVTAAEQNIQAAEDYEFIERDVAHVAYGNFFPADYQPRRIQDRHQDPFGSRIEEHAEECVPQDNPYDVLGIDPEEVDLFMHYQVELEQNIVDFFAEHAKPGAYLLFIRSNTNGLEQLPDNVRVVNESEGLVRMYQKIE